MGCQAESERNIFFGVIRWQQLTLNGHLWIKLLDSFRISARRSIMRKLPWYRYLQRSIVTFVSLKNGTNFLARIGLWYQDNFNYYRVKRYDFLVPQRRIDSLPSYCLTLNRLRNILRGSMWGPVDSFHWANKIDFLIIGLARNSRVYNLCIVPAKIMK